MFDNDVNSLTKQKTVIVSGTIAVIAGGIKYCSFLSFSHLDKKTSTVKIRPCFQCDLNKLFFFMQIAKFGIYFQPSVASKQSNRLTVEYKNKFITTLRRKSIFNDSNLFTFHFLFLNFNLVLFFIYCASQVYFYQMNKKIK